LLIKFGKIVVAQFIGASTTLKHHEPVEWAECPNSESVEPDKSGNCKYESLSKECSLGCRLVRLSINKGLLQKSCYNNGENVDEASMNLIPPHPNPLPKGERG
jgi:hypothetical protein